MGKIYLFLVFSFLIMNACQKTDPIATIGQWQEYEITLTSSKTYDNPYTRVDIHAVFKDSAGQEIVRPGFWDGDNTWKIRFAPPAANNTWTWQTYCSDESNMGLNGQVGQVSSTPYKGSNKLVKNGFLTISEGKRNVIHAKRICPLCQVPGGPLWCKTSHVVGQCR